MITEALCDGGRLIEALVTEGRAQNFLQTQDVGS
jgi:hypothetical protein